MINYCDLLRPCTNGAQCFSEPKGYFCKCEEGFEGKNCEKRVELECMKHQCQHSSQCVPNKSGGYKCICDGKFDGQYCEKKVDLCKNVDCTNKFGNF